MSQVQIPEADRRRMMKPVGKRKMTRRKISPGRKAAHWKVSPGRKPVHWKVSLNGKPAHRKMIPDRNKETAV